MSLPESPVPVRLDKRVCELFNCSRSEAENYIESGWVLVDGEVVEQPQFAVGGQTVELHPQARPEPPEPATFLFNAPAQFAPDPTAGGSAPWLNAATRAPEDHSGLRLLQRHALHLQAPMPLETGASGLLVFSQDPRIVRRLTEDAAKLEQEYVVEVAGSIAEHGLRRLNEPLMMYGRALPRAKVSWQNEIRLRFAITDARPGQIRQLCQSVDLKIVAMKRIRIGRVAMAKLAAGHWRFLSAHERF